MSKSNSQPITVIKQDHHGEEVWRYCGTVLERGEKHIVVEALFDKPDLHFFGMWLCKGDRFIETYYTERWYNIYAIHNGENDRLKGWYCNITAPAEIGKGQIVYRDLALDLLVFPDGRKIVLDKDEFEELCLPANMCQQALQALAELKSRPFT